MKQIYLIHGWGGNPNSEPWFKWIKLECEKKGYELLIPEMPNTDYPKINEWIDRIKDIVKNLNKYVYFIGHSIGCQAVMRYLERVDSDVKIAGAIFIAPWMELDKNTIEEEGEESVRIAKLWMETPIDFSKVKIHTNNFLCILSDNDPYVPLTNKKFFLT